MSSDYRHVALAQGWKLWKTVSLRGTGFPIDMLDVPEATELCETVDAVIDAECRFRQVQQRALNICRQQIKGAHDAEKRLWRHVERKVYKGRIVDLKDKSVSLHSCFQEYHQAISGLSRIRLTAMEQLQSTEQSCSRQLTCVAQNPDFQKAIIWQNRNLFQHAIVPYLTHKTYPINARQRRQEEVITSYLQRYCAKNDSIGYFGPFGWGVLNAEDKKIHVVTGKTLVRACCVRFEYWALRTLLHQLELYPQVHGLFSPRLQPGLLLHNDKLLSISGQPIRIEPAVFALLQACDGERSLSQIVRRLIHQGVWEAGSENQIYQILYGLAKKRVITWGFDLPVSQRSEQALSDLVRDLEKRQGCQKLDAINNLLDLKDQLPACEDDPQALQRKLTDIENAFIQITGEKSTRHPGMTYSGRTLLYLDCQRNLQLTLGRDWIKAVATPLTLVLQSCRWYSHQIGKRLTHFIEQCFQKLAQQQRTSQLPFYVVWQMVMHEARKIVMAVASEVQARWDSLLPEMQKKNAILLESAAIKKHVEKLFPDVPPGWPSARFHSPDLLLLADSLEAANNDRFAVVLGEMHAASNTLLQPIFVSMFPNPEELLSRYERDCPEASVMPVIDQRHVGHRVAPDGLSAKDWHLLTAESSSWKPATRVLNLAELYFKRDREGLAVYSHIRGIRFPVTAFFRMFIGAHAASNFQLFGQYRHSPRISLDRLVLQRERWLFSAQEMPFLMQRDRFKRLLMVRQWARNYKLPRWLFLHCEQEQKPVYVDLYNPVSISIMIRMIKKEVDPDTKKAIRITEMLPNPQQCWLTDRKGQRYASELRLVAFDGSWSDPFEE